MKELSIVVLISIGIVATVSGQTSNATVGGTVSDASGALIPGVSITATNTLTGISTTTISNEAGAYNFPSLQAPGTYKISAELGGFQTNVYDGVVLQLAAQVRLNFTMQVSAVSQSVEVTVAPEASLAASSSSIGDVISENNVRDLPLASRNVLDLTRTTAGAVGSNFGGARANFVNVTRDGISVLDGRGGGGVNSVVYTSPDLVEEMRIIVAPADAEGGRGNGQVQIATRSGTNQFHGSVFEANYNSALNANTWFNNFRGIKKDFVARNQFGGRLGGPVVRNKTFFFVLYEGQRAVGRTPVTGNVLTAEARQGIFRYFPGVQNGNALASTPVVDLQGNPKRPAAATDDLQSFSVFGRDPVRLTADGTGIIQKLIDRMPLPNDYTVGDGLNTAGYTWIRRGTGGQVDRDQINVRLDHNFSQSHKLTLSLTREENRNPMYQMSWPGGFDGRQVLRPRFFTLALTSTLSPTVINEVRYGFRTVNRFNELPWDMPGSAGEQARALLPVSNGVMFIPHTVLFTNNVLSDTDSRYGSETPLYTYADTLSWTRGRHAFKTGLEFRIGNSNGYNSDEMIPRANLGAGGIGVRNIDSTSVPGLIGTNQATAQNLLIDLSGSVSNVIQVFDVPNARNLEFQSILKYRDFHQREFSAFFKDDFKVSSAMTLNLGVRYEYYGVPWEANGLMGVPIGGDSGIFGISGASFADMYQPGRLNGKPTQIEFVGKASTHPDRQVYHDDWNNFAPAIGLSWSIPYFGKDKTVLRSGYSISYQGGGRAGAGAGWDSAIGLLPGVSQRTTFTSPNYLDLSTVILPLSPGVKPLEIVPLTDRTQTMTAFLKTMATPYVQNWSLALQRELVKDTSLEVRYVGTKGTKLGAGIPINEVNIFENGILEAYKITQAGGNAPLFDRMLSGLNLGLGAINGTTVTGSQSLRNNTLTRSLLANNDAGQFASFLNTSTTVTGRAGGLIRNGNLPENFVVANPQFLNAWLRGNPSNSTYHSMEAQVSKRLSHGFAAQGTYTWGRTLGDAQAEGNFTYRNGRNRALDKALLGYHRTHDFRSSGTFELPFGPGRKLLRNSSGILARLTERWQLGAIVTLSSGAPLTIQASTSSFNSSTANTPDIAGVFPKSAGKVKKVTNGVIFFDGYQQVTDPAKAAVTPLQNLSNSFSNYAIADSNGQLVLVNPAAGELGTLAKAWIEGPSALNFDVNLIKRVHFGENKNFEFRIDAIDVLNHPRFGNPTLDINSTNFGRITTATGNRTFILNARINF